ncbi:MAG: glycosyl hydrolase [Roseibacillus sp.]
MASRRDFLKSALAASIATSPATLFAHEIPSPPTKKGLGLATKNPQWAKLLRELDAKWVYTWGSDIPKDTPKKIDFVPMIWGYWGQAEQIRKSALAAKEAGITELLGFNEPDGRHQANMSVQKALKNWPVLMESGLRLGSPACVHPDNDWMKEFMATAKRKSHRVDFVCVHSYGGANSKTFLKRMEKIHRMYQKPLWITEFAVGDWDAKSPEQNRHKPDAVLKFMEKVFPALDKLDYVERHAWFPSSQDNNALGTSALFKTNGNLTRLGEFYRDYQ